MDGSLISLAPTWMSDSLYLFQMFWKKKIFKMSESFFFFFNLETQQIVGVLKMMDAHAQLHFYWIRISLFNELLLEKVKRNYTLTVLAHCPKWKKQLLKKMYKIMAFYPGELMFVCFNQELQDFKKGIWRL